MPRLDPEIISLLESSDDENGSFIDGESNAEEKDTVTKVYNQNEFGIHERSVADRGHQDDYVIVDSPHIPDEPLELEEAEVQEVEDYDTVETEDDDEVENTFKTLSARRKAKVSEERERFKELIADMESTEDLHKLYPKSLQTGHDTQERVHDETDVLREFLPSQSMLDYGSDLEDSYEELEIDDFTLYRSIDHSTAFKGQLEYMHHVASYAGSDTYECDGVIRSNTESRKVVGLSVLALNIGALGDTSIHTTVEQLWIQTSKSRARNGCWYRLRQPAREYRQHWKDSVWLIDLWKHVLEYLSNRSAKGLNVCLKDFSADFWHQINEWHGSDKAFISWHDLCSNTTDFRKHLLREAESFFKDQANSIRKDVAFSEVMKHSVWDEIGAGDWSYDQRSSSKEEKTVVTPIVGAIFAKAFSAWSVKGYDLLEPTGMAPEVAAARAERSLALNFPNSIQHPEIEKFSTWRSQKHIPKVNRLLQETALRNRSTTLSSAELLQKIVVVRKVVSRRGLHDSTIFEYAWVQATKAGKKLRVVWASTPSATACGSPEHDGTFYPIGNELFFTDKCNCDLVPLRDVVGVFNATIFAGQATDGDDMFVRQRFLEQEMTFVTAREHSLLCTCKQPKPRRQQPPNAGALLDNDSNCKLKMKTLGLFCGCGLLDYSLEQSGAFETVIAIDHNEKAIRSHAANAKSSACRHIIGSVNPFIKKCLEGEEAYHDINCVCAGSPCVGFSMLNAHKEKKNGQRNCSLLTSTLSWIDLLLPEYAFIENVPNMDFIPKRRGIANACAQTICFLVALGYQVRKTIRAGPGDGNGTIRTRLFLIAAAPDCILPKVPPVTHGDEADLRALMTVRKTFEGLDPVHNDTAINPRRPDHLPIQRLTQLFKWNVSLRNVLHRIPKRGGLGLVQAFNLGKLSKHQRRWYFQELSDEKRGKNSKTLRRVNPDGFLRTIVTVISPLDSRHCGDMIHFSEDRILTLEELRRAQGLPVQFLLVGKMSEQVEQLGNGVAWQVTAALGRAVASAWKKSVAQGKTTARTAFGLRTPEPTVEYIGPGMRFSEVPEARDIDASTSRLMRAPTSASAESSPESQLQQELEGFASQRADDSTLLEAERLMTKTRPTIVRLGHVSLVGGEFSDDEIFDNTSVDTFDSPTRKSLQILKEKSDDDDMPIGTGRRSKLTFQNRGSTSAASSHNKVVEEVAFSDGESVNFGRDGSMHYRRHQKAKYTETAKPATRPTMRIWVEIPVTKRPAPQLTKEESDDNGIVLLETRPAKKARES